MTTEHHGYTPEIGGDPDKIHRALFALIRKNDGSGATVEQIAELSRVPIDLVRREMSWGLRGNSGRAVIEAMEGGDEKRYRHTDEYHPDRHR